MYIKRGKYRAGFSLVELLVAMAINILIVLALVDIFSSNIKNYNLVVNADTLKQQMQLAMQTMSNDIRRAGYWGNAKSAINAKANINPFMSGTTDVDVSAGNCILFSYDYNSDGNLPSISSTEDDERYGFRLVNQTLQSRPPGAAFSCTAATTAWDNMTNPNIMQISNLSFALSTVTVPVGATSALTHLRTITITMTGNLVQDSSVTITMTQVVRIRNDKFTA